MESKFMLPAASLSPHVPSFSSLSHPQHAALPFLSPLSSSFSACPPFSLSPLSLIAFPKAISTSTSSLAVAKRRERSRTNIKNSSKKLNIMSVAVVSEAEDVSANALIIEPIKKEGTDVLFFFFPGGFTEPKEYYPLVKEVQSMCEFRLWIAILDPGKSGVVMTPMVEASFDGVIQRVKEMGFKPREFPSSNVFMGGHSWGAWSSRSVALKQAEGFIQMGSCFDRSVDNLAQYPKPVLTLCGARDAQMTLATIVQHAGEIFATKSELGDLNMYSIKPVILIQGMNHAQFSHGIPNKARGDLDAEIPIEEARTITAQHLSSFLTIHTKGQPEESISEHLGRLTKAVLHTQERYRSFWEAMDRQGEEGKKLQAQLASLPWLTEENISMVRHDYLDNFVYSKPSIDPSSKRVTIHTYLPSVGPLSTLRNLWIKMKSHEALVLALGDGKNTADDGDQKEAMSYWGARFNEKAFNEALGLVPESDKEKYMKHGKKVCFLEDRVITTSSVEWIESDLVVKAAEDGLPFIDVQSPVLISPVGGGRPSRFQGMHYFKLLTVARAMQLILQDCYK